MTRLLVLRSASRFANPTEGRGGRVGRCSQRPGTGGAWRRSGPARRNGGRFIEKGTFAWGGLNGESHGARAVERLACHGWLATAALTEICFFYWLFRRLPPDVAESSGTHNVFRVARGGKRETFGTHRLAVPQRGGSPLLFQKRGANCGLGNRQNWLQVCVALPESGRREAANGQMGKLTMTIKNRCGISRSAFARRAGLFYSTFATDRAGPMPPSIPAG